MKLSYYDLLGMIKEGNIPKKVYWINNRKEKVLFEAEYDMGNFNYYHVENKANYTLDTEYYLGDNFLESDMFKECIEIPNDDFEDIEEINLRSLNLQSEKNRAFKIKINSLIKNQKKIIEMLKKEYK